ncbi:MAG: adenine phosphoribosyltransferase [Thermoplasmata archaeon]|nr:MAG: adenine phosphoribosyltransferase [Thermoplasmata archaeon]
MSTNILKKTLEEAPIIKKGEYHYVVHPITDGIPEIKPELLKEVTNRIQTLIEHCGKIDRIVTMEAMGIPIATALSLKMNIPFTIIRKRKYGLPGEISVEQTTGYSKSKLYINGLKKGDKIVIVDDVLSTGGTLRAVISALKKMDVIIKGVFIAVDKGNISQNIQKEFNIQIKTLINIDVINNKIVIK